MGVFSDCVSLVPKVASHAQNGPANSYWGQTNAPTLPFWLSGSGAGSDRSHKGPAVGHGVSPWGDITAKGNNPYHSAPNTGKTRHYDFAITTGIIAPDGVQKQGLLVNGQFPGPQIEANYGDWIEVTVTNNLPENYGDGTAMHWHGFLQQGTPFMDGVAGVSQCPIAPGKSFTYRFQATLYGTSWYHAHYSSQYADGIVGPIVVHGPIQPQFQKTEILDLGPIMVQDWYHSTYKEVIETLMAPNAIPEARSDNNLIQGKNFFDCSKVTNGAKCTPNAGLAKFNFKRGKTHRLRFINTGAQGTERITIDNHMMTVIAYDFVEIVPYKTNVITLAVGQRADVLVVADQAAKGSAFWLRADLPMPCSGAKNPSARAAIYYDNADQNKVPTTTAQQVADIGQTCANEDLEKTVPFYTMAQPKPSFTHDMPINGGFNASRIFEWSLAGNSPRINYNEPTYPAIQAERLQSNVSENIFNYADNSSVLINVYNPTRAPHPMHMHGANMYVLHQGAGEWDGSSVVRASNPMRRDTQMVQPFGHIIVQVDTNNPGPWPFHCHIAWHGSMGLYAQLIFSPHRIPRAPASLQQTCRDWDAYTRRVVVDQIDAGM